MTAPPASRLKTSSLRLFIVSIISTAVVGAGAILLPSEGWFYVVQLKILATTSILTGASVCGLVCGGCLALGRRTLPAVGMALVGVAAGTGLLAIWGEISSEAFLKLCGVSTTLAIGCSHVAMLLLMKLRKSYQWVHGLAYFLVLGLASYISLLIVTETDHFGAFQIIGVMSIAATAVSLIIPVLSYLSRGDDEEQAQTAAAIQRRIDGLRAEIADLENRLEQLPPPAPSSPWDQRPLDPEGIGSDKEATPA